MTITAPTLSNRTAGRTGLGSKLAAVSLATISLLGLFASPALAATNGVVDVAAGNTLKVRSTPSSSGSHIGTLADNQAITLTCYTAGETISGTFGTTNRWDKLSTGGYVSQAFVSVTGTLPDCAGTPAPTTGNALVDVAAGNTLTIRSSASTSGSAVGTYADNQRITVTCKSTGTSVSGTFGTTATWYKVSNGYVSAAYTKADTTPATCAAAPAGPTPSAKAQTAISYGIAQMAKPNAYTGGAAGAYRMGAVATVSGLNWQFSGQSRYYLPVGKAGWDCSGLMVTMYQQAGITVPGSSGQIAGLPTVPKTLSSLKPGDMLVKSGHVVMFIGNYNGVPSIIQATPPTSNGSTVTNGSLPAIGVKPVAGYLTNGDYKAVRPAGL